METTIEVTRIVRSETRKEKTQIPLPYYYKIKGDSLNTMLRVSMSKDGELIESLVSTTPNGFRVFTQGKFTHIRENAIQITQVEFEGGMDVIIDTLSEVANELAVQHSN